MPNDLTNDGCEPLTQAQACVRARELLAKPTYGLDEGEEIVLPYDVYYWLQDIDPAGVTSPKNQHNRVFHPDLVRHLLARVEPKIVNSVTKALVGQPNGAANGVE